VLIVVDTNLWISSLFGKQLSDLIDFIEVESVQVLVSPEQLSEIEQVLQRPRLRKNAGKERITVMRRFLKRKTRMVRPRSQVRVCRDPNDDFLLDLALAGKVDCLVTGDKDLLCLDPFRSIRILNYQDFRKFLKDN